MCLACCFVGVVVLPDLQAVFPAVVAAGTAAALVVLGVMAEVFCLACAVVAATVSATLTEVGLPMAAFAVAAAVALAGILTLVSQLRLAFVVAAVTLALFALVLAAASETAAGPALAVVAHLA